MEFRAMESVLAIAETGSFSRAAEKLGYSQSALTMQVKHLESELGAQLFDRIPRGAVLTEEGRAFAAHARDALDAAARAAASVRDAAGAVGDADAVTGTLRIGAVESVAATIVPELVARLHGIHPRVRVVLRTDRGERLADAVREHELDVLLTLDRPLAAAGLERVALREEEVVFAASPGLLEAERIDCDEVLEPERLVRLPLVLTERGESYRRELERELSERGLYLSPIVEAGSTDTLVRLAKQGVGAAFLPRFSVESAFRGGALLPLAVEIDPIRMQVQLAYRKNSWPARHLKTFIELVHEMLD